MKTALVTMHPQDGRVISNFIMQALRNEDITIFGDGSQTRSFQYCDDPKKRKPDITLAKALLNGWEPKIPLQEGLAKTIEYFRGKYGQPV